MARAKKKSRPRSVSKKKSAHKKIPKRVSKPKSERYLKTKSKWVTQSKTPRTYRSNLHNLQDGLRLVRQIYGGFTPARGFDARFLNRWPADRVQLLRDFISNARRLTSGEYDARYSLIAPRSADQARALADHTGQISPRLDHPIKRYVLYANTKTAQARYVRERQLMAAPMGRPVYAERLRVEIVHPVKGGRLVHRDYLFREVLGFQPGVESTSEEGLEGGRALGTFDPWEQMVAAMRMLLPFLPDRTPRGEEAYYRLLTDRGPVGTSVPKHMLLHRMQAWGEEYDPRLVELLLGVRYQGDEFRARKLDVESEKRRSHYQRLRYERRLAWARVKRRPNKKSKLKSKPRRKK